MNLLLSSFWLDPDHVTIGSSNLADPALLTPGSTSATTCGPTAAILTTTNMVSTVHQSMVQLRRFFHKTRSISLDHGQAPTQNGAQPASSPVTPTSPPVAECPEYTLDQVADHCSPDDCWLVIYDKVYNVTNFLNLHPGGEYILLEFAGRDATIAFRGTRHGKDSYEMLEQYQIGILVESERLYS
ncbi:Cytochrome b5 [Halotydeus destructor]|nr:Cytochrome b5 [Halotydeus destructor]